MRRQIMQRAVLFEGRYLQTGVLHHFHLHSEQLVIIVDNQVKRVQKVVVRPDLEAVLLRQGVEEA